TGSMARQHTAPETDVHMRAPRAASRLPLKPKPLPARTCPTPTLPSSSVSSSAQAPEVGAEATPSPPARPAATPAQVQAITARGSDVCVCAGTSSDKTYVLTERFRGLVRDGVAPERILTITFTNKAAREMTKRIGDALEANGVADARQVV